MTPPPLPTSLLLRLSPAQQRIVQATAAIDPIGVLIAARRVTPAEVEAAGGREVLLGAVKEYYASFLAPPKTYVASPEEVSEELRSLAPAATAAIAQMLSGERRVEKTLLETAKYIVSLAMTPVTPGAETIDDPATAQMAAVLRLVP